MVKLVKIDLHMNSQLNVSCEVYEADVAQKFVAELREQMESGMGMAVKIPHAHDCRSVSGESCHEQIWINPEYVEVIGVREVGEKPSE